MLIKHLMLKSGGKITEIHGVGHSTYEGVADWYFIGDLVFEDTPERKSGALRREIPPYAVCFDHDSPEAKAEADAIFNALNDYLGKHGKWHKPKSMKDGRQVNWTPKRKTGSVPVQA